MKVVRDVFSPSPGRWPVPRTSHETLNAARTGARRRCPWNTPGTYELSEDGLPEGWSNRPPMGLFVLGVTSRSANDAFSTYHTHRMPCPRPTGCWCASSVHTTVHTAWRRSPRRRHRHCPRLPPARDDAARYRRDRAWPRISPARDNRSTRYDSHLHTAQSQCGTASAAPGISFFASDRAASSSITSRNASRSKRAW